MLCIQVGSILILISTRIHKKVLTYSFKSMIISAGKESTTIADGQDELTSTQTTVTEKRPGILFMYSKFPRGHYLVWWVKENDWWSVLVVGSGLFFCVTQVLMLTWLIEIKIVHHL